MTFKLLALIIVSISYKNAFSAFVGQKCTSENENGVCTLLKNCVRAIEDLNYDGKLYTKCTPLPDYVGINPIVCCLPKKTEIQEEIPEEWKNLSISERKCLEYAKKINGNYVINLISNSNSRPQTFQKCQFDAVPTIAGGTETAEKEFPHMVLFGYAKNEDDDEDEEEKYTWKCGGTLISELYVLTAAHCNNDRPIILALLGILKITDFYQKEIRGAKAVYDDRVDLSFEYDPATRLNDILLVKLNESVSFNEYIVPACLPSAKFGIGTDYTATGWGATKQTNSQNNHLLKVQLNEIVNCSKLGPFDTKTQICAGSKSEFKNTCRGDSGGPLVIRHQDKEKTPCMYTIVGIVSYGRACFQTNATQSAYTRVSAYVKWIECRVWDVGCNLL